MRHHPQAHCEDCPLYKRNSFVPTEWNTPKPKTVFVGEAPGSNEVRTGKVFSGISGKLLDAVLAENGLRRSESAVTNAVLCRPPGNDDPPAAALLACLPRLHAELAQAQPDHVVALGRVAASALLERKVKITQERVGPPKHIPGKPYKIVPTIHPAACLRNPAMFPALEKDVAKLTRVHVQWEPPKYKVLDKITQARAALHQLLQGRYEKLVLDLEVGEDKDNDFGHPQTLLAAGIGYEPGKVAVLSRDSLRSHSVRRDLAQLLSAKKLIAHSTKYDLGVFHRTGIGNFKTYADTLLMSYTLDENPGTHKLGYLGQEELGAPNWKDDFKKVGGFKSAPLEDLYRYNAYDVGVTWDLYELLDERMDADDHRLHDFLCWASDQLMLIESEGIYIDREALGKLDAKLSGDIEETLSKLRKHTRPFEVDEYTHSLMERNDGFNPNSPLQVRGVLAAMTRWTIPSTDEAHLTAFMQHRRASTETKEFCELMLQWRSLTKLHSTYVKGTILRLNEDGRIQTTYKLHGTETGRLSSANPNVQNVPREGFRHIYAAAPGNVVIYADYGNIEGRIVCVLSGDEAMREVHNDPNRDIHGEMAEAVFGPNYTSHHRFKAKSIVHGRNYNRTAEGVASDHELGMSLAEARKITAAYDRRYPRVREWHEEIRRQIFETDEPLMTPWGRKRRFHLITRENKEDIFKEGLAFKPQSIGSDICLTAAIRLKEQGVAVRILIHDGIMAEAPIGQAQEVANHMREVMEQAGREYSDFVTWPVDVKIGSSWGEAGD